MKCYMCNATLSEHDFCNSCGADVRIYKMIIKSSEAYYNMGLERAKNRDLSGAVDCLRRSVKYNKHNTNARNLLGLVYFEMGEVVEALSQWVISLNLQPEKNLADVYLDEVQRNPGRLDTISQTIRKYNQTVEYAKAQIDGRSENEAIDLAIIQIKKVLNLYPNFVKGHQLLALLYMKTGNYEKAVKPVRKSLAIDKNNALSLQYLEEIRTELASQGKELFSEKPGKGKRAVKEADLPFLSVPDGTEERRRTDVSIVPQMNYKESNGSGGLAVLNIILGIAIGAALFWFLILPNKLQQRDDTFNVRLNEQNTLLDSKSAIISNLQDTISGMEDECESLKLKIASLELENEVIPLYDNLLTGIEQYLAGKTIAAYETFKSIDTALITDESYLAVYDGITALNNINVAVMYYDDGYNNYYNKKKYDEAAAILQVSYDLDPTQKNTMYYLARSYHLSSAEGSNEKAALYYQKVIELFPDSAMAGYSRTYLSRIK